MNCFKCHKEQIVESKISFRAICSYCGADLHVCKNCKFYYPGKPNDCYIPNTDPVKSRDEFNFCEDFVPQDKTFEEKKSTKNSFNNLFKS